MHNWNDDPFANLSDNLPPKTSERTLENNPAKGAIIETATQSLSAAPASADRRSQLQPRTHPSGS